ncbi:MAG: hypothetical protein P8105_01210, partial [Dehalococcoidia bacterium]
LQRVLTNDPGIGVARHADAGYPEAISCADFPLQYQKVLLQVK